jgi:mRNA interferase MazF
MSEYEAKQGHIVRLNFDPRIGHEQQGRRPAVVISNNDVNRFLNKRAMVCPITNTNKHYPFQPELDNRTKTGGVILCDQTMVLDMDARKAEYIETLPDDILDQVIDVVYGMIERV